MNVRLFIGTCAGCLAVFTADVGASVIGPDLELPAEYYVGFTQSAGPDVAGGTFFADDAFLNSFTLDIYAQNAGGTFSAVVMDMVGGLPGSVLWSSDLSTLPSSKTEFLFNPNLAILSGGEYFIGVDTGIYTAASGDYYLRVDASDPFPSNGRCHNLNNTGFVCVNDAYDIYSTIAMSSVPIPAAVWLFGSALAGLGWFRRKQTA